MADEVAPLVGAWIETKPTGYQMIKYGVAPLVGAWIETLNNPVFGNSNFCRTSCRCVD